jgi:hypothetical protein
MTNRGNIMKKQLMIDIETLGKKPGCSVLSIGVVVFDLQSDEIYDQLYVEINRASSREFRLKEDRDTLEWWSKQGEEAQALLARCNTLDNSETMADAINLLTNFLSKHSYDIWANSPSFDLAILAHLYDLLFIDVPWPFYKERDCRTIVALGREFGIHAKKDVPFEGVAHNALDDALHQAKYVSVIFRDLGLLM